MHPIPPFVPSVTLLHKSGARFTFSDTPALIEARGYSWLVRNVGRHFGELLCAAWPWSTDVLTPADWIVRTELGDALTREDFEAAKMRRRQAQLTRLNVRLGRIQVPKGAPVPFTGGRRGGRAVSYLRNPKTTQERRPAALVLVEEGEVPPRPARGTARLVTAWDDVLRGSWGQRSWKAYRKTQWKD